MTLKPRGRCMFCGEPGVTKAHVFPKSWTSLFDEPNGTKDHRVVHRYQAPNSHEAQITKRSKTFALVCRKVCPTCNSGWQRLLEERLLPVAAAFAANEPVELDRNQQEDLACWAVAASLMTMASDREANEFGDRGLARHLHQHQKPPNEMDIWLGANSHGEMGWFGAHALDLSPNRPGKDAWGASISFGYAVVHLVCHNVSEQRMCLKGDSHKQLRRIWGPRDLVAWPPTRRMNDFDLRPLAIAIQNQSYFQRAVHAR